MSALDHIHQFENEKSAAEFAKSADRDDVSILQCPDCGKSSYVVFTDPDVERNWLFGYWKHGTCKFCSYKGNNTTKPLPHIEHSKVK
jgi:hypothetical protein